MKCKITRNAAKVLKRELEQEKEDVMVRVLISHSHGDHAHYELSFDIPTAEDEVIETDKDIFVILEKGQPLLDGVKIDYLYVGEEGFVISNPSKGNHGDH